MTNAEKVCKFLDEAKVFYLLTTDGEQPKGRPFEFHLLKENRIYFGTATIKKCFYQLTTNPHIEILALNGDEFLRYDGIVTIVKDENLTEQVREAMPELMAMYAKNGLKLGLFYLENGTAEICTALATKEVFEV